MNKVRVNTIQDNREGCEKVVRKYGDKVRMSPSDKLRLQETMPSR